MEIPKSTYYYKPKGGLEKKKHNADIADKVEKIAYDFPSYGYRRVTVALRRQGMVVNHKKILKIMKNMGIQCRKRKRFVSTTNSKHNLKVYPNLAKDLIVDRTDKLWCLRYYLYQDTYIICIPCCNNRCIPGKNSGLCNWKDPG